MHRTFGALMRLVSPVFILFLQNSTKIIIIRPKCINNAGWGFMRTQNEINKAQQEIGCYTADSEPFLEWNVKLNEKTGEHEFVSIELSDGSKVDRDSIKTALKRTTGTADVAIGEKILNKIARGMTGKRRDL